MGRLLSSSRPHHDLSNVPSLTSGGLEDKYGKIVRKNVFQRKYGFVKYFASKKGVEA
ncbi:hypothetical protein QJS10_CPB15g00856 [Acorus calamus]|uniref:Uncharacterized protein n=1 Tax=Acorus calamus TaxID=4465 RepID=A0AAV9D7G0_ACOCL|nr:hypothetical protein QJS10_CPB15g00856 [Acorus calamus]